MILRYKPGQRPAPLHSMQREAGFNAKASASARYHLERQPFRAPRYTFQRGTMFATVLDKLSLGTPSTYRNLTLTPILAREPLLAIEPKSLEEGLADGTVKSDGGLRSRSRAGATRQEFRRNAGADPRWRGARRGETEPYRQCDGPCAAALRDRCPGFLYRSRSMGLFSTRVCRGGSRSQSENSLAEGGVRQQEPQSAPPALFRPGSRMGWRE